MPLLPLLLVIIIRTALPLVRWSIPEAFLVLYHCLVLLVFILFFMFFIVVLYPRMVSIGFPWSMWSFLAEQCPQRSHGDPIQPQNYFCFKEFVFQTQFFDPRTSPPRSCSPEPLPQGVLDLLWPFWGRRAPQTAPDSAPLAKFMRCFALKLPQYSQTSAPGTSSSASGMWIPIEIPMKWRKMTYSDSENDARWRKIA